MGWDPFGTSAAKKIKAAASAAADAAREAGEANAKAFRFNEDVYKQNADTVEHQALTDEAKQRRSGNQTLGQQDAAIAGSGFSDVGFDDIREQTADALDLDAIIIRKQGQAASQDWLSQATLAEMNADQAIKTGAAQAKMAILNGSVQAQQAQSSAISGTIGLATQAVGIYMSDARVKMNIERVGTTPNGLPVYIFNYVWDATRRVGVMAQEVVERYPEAVVPGPDGLLAVDYSKIGLPHGYSLAEAIGGKGESYH